MTAPDAPAPFLSLIERPIVLYVRSDTRAHTPPPAPSLRLSLRPSLFLGDNPSRANLNAIADWAAKNFMFNTQAMIVLTQLYW